MPTVHTFNSSSAAYDASQSRDDIRDGDVLAVPSEGVYAVLAGAWPVAVTEECGSFHHLDHAGITWDELDDGRYLASYELARECEARERGYRGGVRALSAAAACEWFARCDRQAVILVSHPVLGWVPCCQRCADRSGALEA